jgi:hypothetical protein
MKTLLITSGCAIAFLASLAASPGPAAAANWTLRQLPPKFLDENSTDEEPIPVSEGLTGISCPTETLCVAVGAGDTLAFSRAPTGGRSSWHVVNPPFPFGPGITCVGGEPDCHTPGGRLQAVSCASQSLCVAVTHEGFIYVSTEPTGGAAAWSPTVVNEPGGHGATHLSSVSCPSPSFCAAVTAVQSGIPGGKVLTSNDPTSGRWQVTQLDGSLGFQGISCGTPSLCVAVAREGRIVVSTDPTGGIPAWTEVGTPGGSGDVGGVDCVEASPCVAGNEGGNILSSTAPAGGAATWNELNAGGSVLITGVSCPTASRCVAVDNNGDVLTSPIRPRRGAPGISKTSFSSSTNSARPLGTRCSALPAPRPRSAHWSDPTAASSRPPIRSRLQRTRAIGVEKHPGGLARSSFSATTSGT